MDYVTWTGSMQSPVDQVVPRATAYARQYGVTVREVSSGTAGVRTFSFRGMSHGYVAMGAISLSPMPSGGTRVVVSGQTNAPRFVQRRVIAQAPILLAQLDREIMWDGGRSVA